MSVVRKFHEIIGLIEKKRKHMSETNPLFKTLANEKLSYERRMLFVPYMLFFSCGGPDVVTLLMRVEKKDIDLSFVEKKINDFVNEDNFHYNFYLKDLETVGYTLKKFGTVNGVIRHVFSEESISVRKLVYSLSHYCRHNFDPHVRLTVCELIEAGLFDLFITVYTKIIKQDDSPFAQLHYYGDTHVNLEKNHTVTSWFSGNDSGVFEIEILKDLFLFLTQAVEEIMDNFNEMYLAFNEIILKGDTIFPDKYKIDNLPPIHQITNKNYSRN